MRRPKKRLGEVLAERERGGEGERKGEKERNCSHCFRLAVPGNKNGPSPLVLCSFVLADVLGMDRHNHNAHACTCGPCVHPDASACDSVLAHTSMLICVCKCADRSMSACRLSMYRNVCGGCAHPCLKSHVPCAPVPCECTLLSLPLCSFTIFLSNLRVPVHGPVSAESFLKESLCPCHVWTLGTKIKSW